MADLELILAITFFIVLARYRIGIEFSMTNFARLVSVVQRLSLITVILIIIGQQDNHCLDPALQVTTNISRVFILPLPNSRYSAVSWQPPHLRLHQKPRQASSNGTTITNNTKPPEQSGQNGTQTKPKQTQTVQVTPSLEEFQLLVRTQVIVRLNVVVDPTLARQFNNNFQRIRDFVWAVFFEMQLYYDKPELNQAGKGFVRYAFVITHFKVTDFLIKEPKNIQDFVDSFHETRDAQDFLDQTDLHVLLTYRDHYHRIRYQKFITQGIAFADTFCTKRNAKNPPVAVIAMRGFSNALTIAHEFAHAFGLPHDGFPVEPYDPGLDARKCLRDNGTVMAQDAFFYGSYWSECSADSLFYVALTRFRCILDPKRIGNIKPHEASMDWRLFDNYNPLKWRDILPGQKYNLLDQCQIVLGPKSFPMDRPKGYDVCQNLTCDLARNKKGRFISVFLGPPLSGSECRSENYTGICLDQYCVDATNL